MSVQTWIKGLKVCLALCMAVFVFPGCQREMDTVSGVEPHMNGEKVSPEMGSIAENDNHAKHGIYYEVFVRSFADSNGDGIGDIRGLTGCLDYLNDGDSHTETDLEIDGIYLMPIHASSSYHGYDVTDYTAINPEYGTLEDFSVFLKEAHTRNIRVIMDLVVNHTGREHPWFREASKSPNSPYRDYYSWADEATEGIDVKSTLSSGSRLWHKANDAYYYAYFWDGMPDLNYDNPKVREEIKKIAAYWLEMGVDGFRLDAAMHIYGVHEKPVGLNIYEKNLAWWKEFRENAEKINPQVYLVGEVWEKTYAVAPYYQVFDSLFNFDAAEGIINTVLSGSGITASDKGLARWLSEKYQTYEKSNTGFIDAPFLSNHDQNRIMERLKGDVSKAKLAAAIFLTLPGNPFIYYGEEIGMKGAKPDENIRVPFIWFSESKPPQCTWRSTLNNFSTVPEEIQQTDPDSLLNTYKTLIRVRHSSRALMEGGFEPVDTGNRAVVAYSRFAGKTASEEADQVVVFHNVSDREQLVALSEKYTGARLLYDSRQQSSCCDATPESSTFGMVREDIAPGVMQKNMTAVFTLQRTDSDTAQDGITPGAVQISLSPGVAKESPVLGAAQDASANNTVQGNTVMEMPPLSTVILQIQPSK